MDRFGDGGNIQKRKVWLDRVFLVLLAVFLGIRTFHFTMFRLQLGLHDPIKFWNLWIPAAAALILAKELLLRCYRRREILVGGLLCILCVVSYYHCWTKWVEVFPFLVIAAKDVDFDRILKVFLAVTGGVLLCAVIASQTGLITDLVYARWLPDGTIIGRHSYGTTFPTTFSEFIFFLCAAWTYVRRKKINFLDTVLLAAAAAVLKIQCDAKTGTACVGLLAVLSVLLFVMRKSRKKKGREENAAGSGNTRKSRAYAVLHGAAAALTAAFPVGAAAMIVPTMLYRPDSPALTRLDYFTTARLRVGRFGLDQYGIRLFGSKVKYYTTGGDVNKDPGEKYMNFDCSYLLVLVNFGIAVFVILMALFVFSCYCAWKLQDTAMLFILAVIALECMFENRLMQPQYDIFCLIFFSRLENDAGRRYDVLNGFLMPQKGQD